MDKEFQKSLAKQLRKPEGEMAIKVALAMNESNKQMNEFAIESLNLMNGDKILEIGMGNGKFVKDLFAKNSTIHYSACDYSKEMIDSATELNQSLVKLGKAEFIEANVSELPFPNKSFDVIFTVNTLYFWDDPKKILTELNRLLKTNGKLYIIIRTKDIMQNFPFTEHGFQLYSEQDLHQLLENNNWRVVNSITKKEGMYQFDDIKIHLETLIVSAQPN